MDRRTGLAFVLIFAILLASNYLMPKFMSSEPQNAAVDSSTEAVPVDESPTTITDPQVETTGNPVRNPAVEPPAFPPSGESSGVEINTVEQAVAFRAPGPEETLTVNTPLYELVLSSYGARIESFKLKEHLDEEGNQVQLIPADHPERGRDAMLFRGGTLELGRAAYTLGTNFVNLETGDTRSIELVAETVGGLQVVKIMTFDASTYGVDVDYVLRQDGSDAARKSLNLLGSPEDFRFSWNQGIAPTERVERIESPAMRSIAMVGDQFEAKKRDGLKKNVEKVQETMTGSVRYAGVQDKYFTIFGIVPSDHGAVEGTIRLDGDPTSFTQSWEIEIPTQRGAGSDIATARLHYFIGPATRELVRVYGEDLEEGIDLGMKIIRPLSSLVLGIMSWMHGFIPNYGVIIILFSVITKLAFYPLTKAQTESMKRMQEVQPKLKELQEKYKNDKEKLNQATMKLYQEEKVNPLAGCLPLLVQMPVFFALYQALNHTIALRGQPFVGWITDLSSPDALFVMPFSLPFLGSDFNVLPILMAVAMYFQTKLSPSAGGGQMAAMNTMLPLFMVFIFYNMPSGLVLYWLVNTIMTAYQTWRIQSKKTATQGAQA